MIACCCCAAGFSLVAAACDDPITVEAVVVEAGSEQACATSSAPGGKTYCFPVGDGEDTARVEVGDCVEVRLATESARVLGAERIACPEPAAPSEATQVPSGSWLAVGGDRWLLEDVTCSPQVPTAGDPFRLEAAVAADDEGELFAERSTGPEDIEAAIVQAEIDGRRWEAFRSLRGGDDVDRSIPEQGAPLQLEVFDEGLVRGWGSLVIEGDDDESGVAMELRAECR